LANSGTTLVNPFDQYTGTAIASKIFNGGILTLSYSYGHTNYQDVQNPGPTSSFTEFTTNTFNESAAFALGPILYAYSDGAFSARTENANVDPNSSAYRVVGGLGTRQIGLYRASGYFGYQSSWAEGSGTAGGDVFGGKISYFPSYTSMITAAVDETINNSSQTVASTQALALQPNAVLQIPTSSSTRITNSSLQGLFSIAPLWTLVGTLDYIRTEYIDSPRIDNGWLADLSLSYEMWRNMTLTWEYQYTAVVSSAPGNSAQRNLVMMSANYRF